MTVSLTYLQLLEVLTDLVNSKAAGTMFIHSQCNHAITFSLDAGRIHAIYHGPRRGRNAIPLIGRITGGSYRFDSAGLGRSPQDLPSTAEILEQLKTLHSTTRAPAVSSPVNGSDPISAEQKQRVCYELKKLLTEHLGPIAAIVFDDTVGETGDFCSSPARTRILIDMLVNDIDNPAEATQFRVQAQSVISGIVGS
jgi:hypothetical protein